MNVDLALERLEDAIDARGYNSMDYKAGLLLGFIKSMAKTYPEVHGQVVAMTTMLEKWTAEEEAERRAANAEVDGYC